MFNHGIVIVASSRARLNAVRGGRRRGADTDTRRPARVTPPRDLARRDVTYSILILCAILEIFLDTRYRVSM